VCDRAIKQLLLAIIPLLVVGSVSNVYAGGPRLDYPDPPPTPESSDCWVDGYDAGFAGKYDSDRAKECYEDGGDSYNSSWDGACIDGGHTENECNEIMNNPVDLGDHEQLQDENKSDCYYDGINDGQADNSYDKDRASGCSEYGGMYTDGYQFGCQRDSTQSSCELLISGEKSYCPSHPDIVACVEFLHNATNKGPAESGLCASPGNSKSFVICPQESNPEGYCLNNIDPAFCKIIGDLCDEDGFVKPEYPYCKND
jgi:hypothetical protein